MISVKMIKNILLGVNITRCRVRIPFGRRPEVVVTTVALAEKAQSALVGKGIIPVVSVDALV